MPASMTGNENSLRTRDGVRDSGSTFTLGSADSCDNMNFFGIWPDRSKQAVQIGPRDIQAAGGHRFVAVALLDGGGRQLQFVIAQQPLERAGRQIAVGRSEAVIPQRFRQMFRDRCCRLRPG